MKRRTLLAASPPIAASALTASSLAAPAIARTDGPIRWRMATSWPRDLPGPGVSARRLTERIAALSAGRLEVELFAAGELVPAFEVMDAVGGGVVEMGHSAAVFWQGKAPAAAFFLAAPMGLTPIEHEAWIRHGGGQALWDALYRPFGVKPYLAGNTGMSMGGWFRRPIESVADLRGLKWRMPGLGGRMYRALGVLQVSIPPGEILPALQTGALDAAEFAGPSSDLALGLHEAAPHYYGPGLHEPNGASEALIGLDALASLPEDLAAIVEAACALEHAAGLAESERANAAALERMIAQDGVELRAFPDDVIAGARDAAAEIFADFAGRDGIEGEIGRSYSNMLTRRGSWPIASMARFLEARAR